MAFERELHRVASGEEGLDADLERDKAARLKKKRDAELAARVPGRRTLVEQLPVPPEQPAVVREYRGRAMRDVVSTIGAIARGERGGLLQTGPGVGDTMMRVAERRAHTLMRRAQDHGEVDAGDPAVEESLARMGGGAPLPEALRKKMEAEFGVSFARVRVHTDGIAAQAAAAVHAEAFTVGEDIFFAEGAFDPGSKAGQHLIAHELTHVVQGMEGRVAAAAGVSKPGQALETEAEHRATRVVERATARQPVRAAAPVPAPTSIAARAPRTVVVRPAAPAAPMAPGVIMRRAAAGAKKRRKGKIDVQVTRDPSDKIPRITHDGRAKLHAAKGRLDQVAHSAKAQAKNAVEQAHKHPTSPSHAAGDDHHKHIADLAHKGHEHAQKAAHAPEHHEPKAEHHDKNAGTGAVKLRPVADWHKLLPRPLPDQDEKETKKLLGLVKARVEKDRHKAAKLLSSLKAAQLKASSGIAAMKGGLQAQIAGVQKAALGKVSSTEAAQVAAVQSHIAGLQAQVRGAASAAIASVDQAHRQTIQQMTQAFTQANQKLAQDHTQALSKLQADTQAELTEVSTQFEEAETTIRAYGGQKQGEASAMGDIALPYSGDKLEAARKAAHEVAEKYAAAMPENANQAAEQIAGNVGDAQEAVRHTSDTFKEQLETAFNQSKSALQQQHQQMVQAANQAHQQAVSHIRQASSAAISALDGVKSSTVASLHSQAASARSSISSAGAAAIAGVASGCDKAAAGLAGGAEGVIHAASKMETPDPKALGREVAKARKDLAKGATGAAAGLRTSASSSATSLTQQATQAASSLAQAASAANASASKQAQSAEQGLRQTADTAKQGLHKVGEEFAKTATKLTTKTQTAFEQLNEHAKTAFDQQTTTLKGKLQGFVDGCKGKLDEAVPGKERPDILAQAKKAADAVPAHWWQKVVSFVVKVVIAVAIGVAVGALIVATGGVGGILLAAAIGAAGGALGYTASLVAGNLIEGKSAFDNFSWKGLAVAAVAGGLTAGATSALGGLAEGATSGFLGAFAEGSSGLGNFAIKTATDFGIGMVSDAIAQKVITGEYKVTLEDVLLTAATAGISNSTKLVGGGAHEGASEGGSEGGGGGEADLGGGGGHGGEGEGGGGAGETQHAGGGSEGGTSEAGHGANETAAKGGNEGAANDNAGGGKGGDEAKSGGANDSAGKGSEGKGANGANGKGANDSANGPEGKGANDNVGKGAGEGEKAGADQSTTENKGGSNDKAGKSGGEDEKAGGSDQGTTENKVGSDEKAGKGGEDEKAAANDNSSSDEKGASNDNAGKSGEGEKAGGADKGTTENKGGSDDQTGKGGEDEKEGAGDKGGEHEKAGEKEGGEGEKEGGEHGGKKKVFDKHKAHEKLDEALHPKTKGQKLEDLAKVGEKTSDVEKDRRREVAEEKKKEKEEEEKSEHELEEHSHPEMPELEISAKELEEDGYAAAEPRTFSRAVDAIVSGRAPDPKDLRTTQANHEGRAELERLLADPNLSPEQRQKLQRDLAARLSGGTAPTGNLKREVQAVRTEERDAVQRKSTAAPTIADPQAVAAQGTQGPGGALPHLDQIQASFGRYDVSGVQAHVGGAAAGASAQLGAQAYAHGNAVAFASQPDLHTAAHEAAHVVQQRGGVQLKGGIDGGASDPYEQHADAVADAVVAGRSAEGLLGQHGAGGSTSAQVQRAPAEQQETPGGMITVSLFDKNKHFITSRSEPLYGSASARVYLAAIVGGTLRWQGDPIDVQLGDKVGKDGKLLGAVSVSTWAKQAGGGQAAYVFVEVDVAEVQTQDANSTAKPTSSTDASHGVQATAHSDGQYGIDSVSTGARPTGVDGHGDGGDSDQTRAGELDAEGHDGTSTNHDGEKGGTRKQGGRGKSGGADGSRLGKHGAQKRDVGYFWDPNHQHDGSQDTAPDNADKDGAVGGAGKHGDEGIPDVGAWKARIPIPKRIRTLVGIGVILYQVNVQQIAKDLIKSAAKATTEELAALAATKIDSLADHELAALVAKDAQFAAMTDAELAEARSAIRAEAVEKVQAELDAQIAGAEKNAATDAAHSIGQDARYAADDLKQEQDLAKAAKRARDSVTATAATEGEMQGVANAPESNQAPASSNSAERATETQTSANKLERNRLGATNNKHSGIDHVKAPADRHRLMKVTQGSVAKELNTVIEPRVDVAADVTAINDGKAVAEVSREGVRTYSVNGRTYGVEPNGTLYPMTGDGFIVLNRNSYKVLGIFRKFGDTPRALEIISLQGKTAKFTPDEIELARMAWRAGGGASE